MREAGRATVMDALPDALPDVAVILVMPLLSAVTNPFVFTVATVESPLVQDTEAPLMASPLAS